jgi:hypothetical protein
MRAELVELLAEVVELVLLGREAAGGRDGGIPLEGSMHAFVDGVLLGAARLDELGVDAELDEPDGEGGETSQGAGGEGDAVVGADAVGQAEPLEQAGEVLLGEFKGDGWVGVDAEQLGRATEFVIRPSPPFPSPAVRERPPGLLREGEG